MFIMFSSANSFEQLTEVSKQKFILALQEE